MEVKSLKVHSKRLFISIIVIAILITSTIIISQTTNSKEVASKWGIPTSDEVVSMINRSSILGSLTAMDSEWIYFSEYNSENTLSSQGTLYRMKHDGSEVQQILDTATRNLLIVEDKLYFLDVTNSSAIYSLSLKDFTKTLVYNDRWVGEFLLVDDWIYFTEETDREFYSQLSRIKRDGSDYTVLVSDIDFGNLRYKGDYIFFYSTGIGIHRMHIESGELELLINSSSHLIAIFDNKLLITGRNPIIFDLDTRTSEDLVKISLQNSSLNFYNFYYDALYAIALDQKLVKITQDGHEVIFNERPVSYFNIVGDWLFLGVEDGQDTVQYISLYRMNLITGEIEKVSQLL